MRLRGVLITLCAVAAGLPARAAGAFAVPTDDDIGGWALQVSHRLSEFWSKLSSVLAALPEAPGQWVSAVIRIVQAPSGGRSLLALMFILAACVSLMLLCDRAMRLVALRLFRQPRSRFGAALLRLAYEVVALLLSFGISVAANSAFFTGTAPAVQFAKALLWAIVLWRVGIVAVFFVLRPDDARLRGLNIPDEAAKRVAWRAAGALALAISFNELVYVLIANGLPARSAQSIALVVGSIAALMTLSAGGILRKSVPSGSSAAQYFMLPLVLMLWGTWSASVVTLDFTTFDVVLRTIEIAWALLAVVRLLDLAIPDEAEREAALADDKMRARMVRRLATIPPIQRSLMVICGAFALVVLGRLWVVDVLGLLTLETWRHGVGALSVGLSVLVVGYVGYEFLRGWAASHDGENAHSGDDEETHPKTRLGTILPIVSGALAATTVIIALLFTLSELGVNTAPLLAGASIFGLALSFGSQALVKDIVSGIFYMADDAFRVGEYIEAGRLKGTVEKILVRSVRVRHQNGQIHTIPFGQLGAVTNYSRDWSTIKFNLRFARGSDIDLIRKTAKKCGQDLLADPEYGPEFIQPLKLQGVADILENALVCRFKFTVKPMKPAEIQREALKRIYRYMTEQGIEFASNSVTIQTTTGNNDPNVISESAQMAAALSQVMPSQAVS